MNLPSLSRGKFASRNAERPVFSWGDVAPTSEVPGLSGGLGSERRGPREAVPPDTPRYLQMGMHRGLWAQAARCHLHSPQTSLLLDPRHELKIQHMRRSMDGV